MSNHESIIGIGAKSVSRTAGVVSLGRIGGEGEGVDHDVTSREAPSNRVGTGRVWGSTGYLQLTINLDQTEEGSKEGKPIHRQECSSRACRIQPALHPLASELSRRLRTCADTKTEDMDSGG